MKIISLRFQNINSLAGTWEINFQDPEYTQHPLFAITGPTGSGKTTILDAICFALYFKTPRQQTLSGNSNKILTRNQIECFAELVFETQNRRYRAYSYQNKSNKSCEGNLQPPKREIVDDFTGEIIASGAIPVSAVMPRIIGLNFDQFTKAIMLAQGSFNAFLVSNPDARADILEKLSGTEIYSLISKKVHERQTYEQKHLDALKKELEFKICMPPDERKMIELKIRDLSESIHKLNGNAKDNQAKLEWRKKLDEAVADKDKLLREIEDNERLLIEFAPVREKIKRAQKANALIDAHQNIVKCRRDLKDASASQEKHANELHVLLPQIEKNNEKLKIAESEFRCAEQKIIDNAPDIKNMRERDFAIKEKENIHKKNINELEKDRNELEKATDQLKKCQKSIDAIRKKIDLNNTELDKNKNDLALIENYSGIEAKISQINAHSNECAYIQKEIDCIDREIKKKQKEHARALEIEKKANDDLISANEKLGKAEKERDSNLNGKTIEMIEEFKLQAEDNLETLKKLDKFKAERATLKEGEPCPLCGATHHPGISIEDINAEIENISAEIENYSNIIKRNKTLEKAIQTAKEKCDDKKYKLREAQLCSNAFPDEIQSIQKRYDEKSEMLTRTRTQCNALKNEIQGKLASYGLELSETDTTDLLKSLKNRCNHYKELQNNREKLNSKMSENAAKHAFADGEKKSREADLAKCENKIRDSEECLMTLKAERTRLYGTTSPDALETQLNDDKKNKIDVLKSQKSICETLVIHQTMLKSKCDSEDQLVKKLTAEREKSEIEFAEKYRNNGFDTEDALTGALLSPEDLTPLETQQKQLDDRRKALNVKREQNTKICAKLAAQHMTDETLETLNEKQQALETKKTQFSESLGENRQKCAQDDQNIKESASKQQEIDKQDAVVARWNRLHALIGSNDGKVYKQYVQGLTFSHLVKLANRYLQKFNNRFILICQSDEIKYEIQDTSIAQNAKNKDPQNKNVTKAGLSFAVIDAHQDNKIRDVSNLSGGESFQVSLALALGLSDMASRNIEIGTLFLDEGFGTLDADTLSKVLTELSFLMNESNKTVGIISHVEALKETVSTQIQLVREPGGFSSIHGPGCRNFSPKYIADFNKQYDAQKSQKKSVAKNGKSAKSKKKDKINEGRE